MLAEGLHPNTNHAGKLKTASPRPPIVTNLHYDGRRDSCGLVPYGCIARARTAVIHTRSPLQVGRAGWGTPHADVI